MTISPKRERRISVRNGGICRPALQRLHPQNRATGRLAWRSLFTYSRRNACLNRAKIKAPMQSSEVWCQYFPMLSDSRDLRPFQTGVTMKVVVFGLPGSGRSTLARELGRALDAVVLDEDRLFETLNSDLDRSPQGYTESARRIGWAASAVLDSGVNCVCDMMLPTQTSRDSFRISKREVYAIWMDTIDSSKDANANAMWESLKPVHCNLHISNWCWEIDPILSVVSRSVSKWGELASPDSDFTAGSRDNPDTIRDTDGPETVIGRREESDRRARSHDRRSIVSSVWGLLNTKL